MAHTIESSTSPAFRTTPEADRDDLNVPPGDCDAGPRNARDILTRKQRDALVKLARALARAAAMTTAQSAT